MPGRPQRSGARCDCDRPGAGSPSTRSGGQPPRRRPLRHLHASRAETPLARQFTLKIVCGKPPKPGGGGGGGSLPKNSFKVSTKTKPDGLLDSVVDGRAGRAWRRRSSSSTPSCPTSRGAYPAAGDGWWIRLRQQHRRHAEQAYLPAHGEKISASFPPPAADRCVDGTATVKTDRDEHHRLVTTYDFDLLLARGQRGGQILSLIRGRRASGKGGSRTILRESSSRQSRRTGSCASFTILESADRPAADELDGDDRAEEQPADLRGEDLRRRGPDPDPKPAAAAGDAEWIAIGVGRFKSPSRDSAIAAASRATRSPILTTWRSRSSWTYEMFPPKGADGPALP